VEISSASIGSFSRITANLPLRCHYRNQTKPSTPPPRCGLAAALAKSQIKQTRNPFPSFIAINSQLQ
jgi:hypothetical protein